MDTPFSSMSTPIEDRTRVVLDRESGLSLDARIAQDIGAQDMARWRKVAAPVSNIARMARGLGRLLAVLTVGQIAR